MNLSNLFSKNKKSSGIFVPSKTNFVELTDEISFKSINGITEHLGYHSDQVFAYYESSEKESGILNIIVEVFTSNIIFIITVDSVNKLDTQKVRNYMKNYNLKTVFNIYTTESILESGIENKSLHINFLAKIFNIEEPEEDGMFYVPSIEYYLYFVDGYLNGFQSSDGLNEPAKSWRQNYPTFFRDLEEVTKLYWNDNLSNVTKEINMQADAFNKIPFGMNNEYLELHRTKHNTINFVMLRVCHYNYKISLTDFVFVNNERYIEIDSNNYIVDNFMYEFDDFGDFVIAHSID